MEFPDWVEGPTLCKTRTFSVSLAIEGIGAEAQRLRNRYPTKIVRALENKAPVIPVRNLENGKLYPHYVGAPLDTNRFELVEN